MALTWQRGAYPITLDRPRTVFFCRAATWLLVNRYGFDFVGELYALKTDDAPEPEKKPETRIALKSIDALTYFLWAGLQADCKQGSDTLTLEQTAELIRPDNLRQVFNAVLVALTAALSAPAIPKGEAARPAAKRPAKTKKPTNPKANPGPTRASTLMTRSASPSPR